MKKVFSSNSQLAHVWANQLQSEGRAANMFFEGPVIYSYGRHYEIARFIEAPNGEKICFINSNGYSNSTAKHTNHVYHAIPDGIRTFYVPFSRGASFYGSVNHINEQSLPYVVERLLLDAKNLIFDQLKAKSRFSYFNEAGGTYRKAVEICELFGLPVPALPENWEAARVKSEHLRENHTEKEKTKEAKELEKSRELLAKWLNYEFNGTLYNIPVHLRISTDGRLIETTRGARVNMDAALRLLAKLRNNEDVKGEVIDGFTVIENSNEAVKIGCHTITWPVINEFFNK